MESLRPVNAEVVKFLQNKEVNVFRRLMESEDEDLQCDLCQGRFHKVAIFSSEKRLDVEYKVCLINNCGFCLVGKTHWEHIVFTNVWGSGLVDYSDKVKFKRDTSTPLGRLIQQVDKILSLADDDQVGSIIKSILSQYNERGTLSTKQVTVLEKFIREARKHGIS